MGVSPDLLQFPHTTANDRPPQLGDLFSGAEGVFAVCFIGPATCTGLLAGNGYVGIVDVPLGDMTKAFPIRVLVKESIQEMVPGTRLQ